MFNKFVLASLHFVSILNWGNGVETKGKTLISPKVDCPLECTCELAPMRTASFVLKWMTSWGEDDLPNVHPNDILDANMMVASKTAKDAEVNVESVGRHATCSVHPTTNVTQLLSSLPKNLMVLSLLQAPGCNLTIIDGGQLENLKSLKGLHLQGYAHKSKKQVSGFTPNRVSDVIKHREMMEKEPNEKMQSIKLRLALAEDTLESLLHIQLLDIQYVRLVASKEDRRSRRYSSKPVDSRTLLDMPLSQFLRMAGSVDSFRPPPYMESLSEQERSKPDVANDINNNIPEMTSLYSKLQEQLMKEGMFSNENNLEGKKPEINDLPVSNEVEEVVPYDLYLSETQPELAPFKSLANLKYLRVAHAKLDRIGPELLDGLQKLHTLTLEYNNVQVLPDRMFSPTPTLRHLSLAHNKLFSLDSESFNGLTQLLTLDLDYNNLAVLGPASLPHLPSLKTMRVMGNPIAHLLPDAFTSLNSTKGLYLGSSNVSMDIHEDSFRFLSSLEILVLENITMKTLEKTLLGGMEKLKRLSAHGHIPVIDYDAFSTTPLLIKLDLSRCQLTRLSMDAFFGLAKLRSLDLSHNELTSISPGTFDHLVELRLLYLHHNNLNTLPLGIFLPIPAKLIQLNHNPWKCSCDLLQLRPSITNKVTKPPRISCTWDDKLETTCKKIKGRLVYDARVAPLCSDPPELRGNDVYHAALRHLKCSKYHWDPRLLLKTTVPDEPKRQRTRKPKKKVNINKKEVKEDGSQWLPLIAFTPKPVHKKDLLEIAEREGLEEVTTKSSVTPKNIKPHSQKNGPQNDEPKKLFKLVNPHLFKYRFKTTMNQKSNYDAMKNKEKRRMKLDSYFARKQRMEEKEKIKKEMEEKIRIKALIREKQRRIHQKKMLKMKMKMLN